VRVSAPPIEGKLVKGAPGLDVGDRLSVQLAAVNVDHGFIDFERT
jgi:exoribonuclease-2